MDLLSNASSLVDWLSPSGGAGIGDYMGFRLINTYLTSRIGDFGLAMMGRMMKFVAGIAVSVVTLWVLSQGYRILTGQLRDPLMKLVVDGLKIALCLGIATSMGVGGVKLYTLLTHDMDEAVHELVTGNKGQTTADAVDKNLAYLQIAMTAIDSVQVLDGNPELLEEKRTAKFFAGLGAAGPAIAAGVMLLLMKIVVAMWVGFGPLFIFAFAFDATKAMFHRWLQYGLGALFTMAMLSFISGLILDLMIRVSAATWLIKLTNISGASAEGISGQAMEQGGMGLILTMLIISVPPIAAHFFQGQVGNFMHFSAFSSQGQPGAQGQPPGSSQAAPVNPNTPTVPQAGAKHGPDSTYNHANRVSGQPIGSQENRVKSADEVRKD
ncbi:type IV secretion system protein [Lysobacter firmicutimachus]|uniref:Type IV secretion system protein n=1 Tax=Lysobacter firmicutimachus TaxID=1792846 RepID=A0ABU8D8Z2_9GAMM